MKHKKKQIIMHAARSKNCGQCALACPTRFIHIFNPLGVLRSLQMEDIEETLKNWDIFNCLCCNRCMLECPVSISAQSNNTETMNFANLIRDLRAYAHEKNIDLLKDKKIAQRFTHIYEKEEDLKENPIISYIKENKRLKISDNGEIGYFLGDFQDKNGLLYPEIAESVMKILNKVGIKPKLIHSAGAGHDNYWVGNDQLFKKIVQFNIKKIEEAEVKTIITYSAETFHTLKYIYPKYQKDFDKEYNIVHLSQFLSQNHLLSKFHIRPNIKSSIVIHDNSRMGRMGDQCYDPLREAF